MISKRFFMFLTGITLLCLVSQVANCQYGYLDIEKLLFEKSVIIDPITSPQITEVDNRTQNLISKKIPELILVNKAIRLDKSYEPIDLIPIKGIYLREMASSALVKMLSGAESEGINGIVVYSGYRSYATQSVVYNNKIASQRPKYGEEAEEMAAKLVAPPGASEHQTGLAVDLTLTAFLKAEYVLNYDFADTVQGRWLRNNGWKYGFILRFDEDKEGKTGVSYEPWHFRYVGLEHSKAIYERNICLEEYLEGT